MTGRLVELCQHLGLLVNLEKSELAATEGDRISRRKVRFAKRTSVPHGRTPVHNDAASIRGKRSAGPVEWDMAETQPLHKLVGVTSGAYRTAVTPVSSQREDSSVHRQLDHSLLSEQAGGEQGRGRSSSYR